jgi:predicted RNase H-like nuclease (RuvC/YqgF family)
MSQADRLKILRSDYERASAVYAENHPDVVRLKRMVDALESSTEATASDNDRVRQLRDAESRLAQMRQRYAPEHPDVVRLERLVSSLMGEPVPGRAAATSAAASAGADNPVYIQLRTQREALSNEHRSLQAKRVALGTRLTELERRLESSPGVERDYTAMRRDLDNTQTKYREVRQKQMEAQLAQSLELERKGERFSLIEPPLVPEEPASPNRQMIIVLGLVMALVAAGGTALLLEVLDGSVRGAGDIAVMLTAAPLAVIPHFQVDMPVAGRRRRTWALLAAAVAGAVALLMLVHFFYRPLDVLWAVLSRRLGG